MSSEEYGNFMGPEWLRFEEGERTYATENKLEGALVVFKTQSAGDGL